MLFVGIAMFCLFKLGFLRSWEELVMSNPQPGYTQN